MCFPVSDSPGEGGTHPIIQRVAWWKPRGCQAAEKVRANRLSPSTKPTRLLFHVCPTGDLHEVANRAQQSPGGPRWGLGSGVLASIFKCVPMELGLWSCCGTKGPEAGHSDPARNRLSLIMLGTLLRPWPSAGRALFLFCFFREGLCGEHEYTLNSSRAWGSRSMPRVTLERVGLSSPEKQNKTEQKQKAPPSHCELDRHSRASP